MFGGTLSTTEETFSLPIADADQLLHEVSSDALRYARLREMLVSGKAKLERLTVLRSKSGQRAVAESFDELRYGSEFRPPEIPRSLSDGKVEPVPEKPLPENLVKNGGIPIAFETRNVGDTLELEAVLGPDEMTIDLNLVTQSVRYVGDHADGGLHPVKTPIFETSKVTTSVNVSDGQPYFLGTINPPFGNGLAREQKEQRVWLDFLTVHVVRLEDSRVLSKNAAALLAKAKAMIIPKLDFREASVAEAVDFLRRKSVELDPEKKGVAIVLKEPPKLKVPPKLADVKITFSLNDAPLEEAVQTVAYLADLIVEPQDYALLLRSAGRGR